MVMINTNTQATHKEGGTDMLDIVVIAIAITVAIDYVRYFFAA